MTKQNSAIELSLDIANFLNKVNRNCFTKQEILTTISVEYQDMLENNDKELILETLQSELENSYGSDLVHTLECQELINQVNQF